MTTSSTWSTVRSLLDQHIQNIQGYWTRTKMLVTPTHGQSRTILLFSEIQYDLGLADELFEHAELTK
ncbi:outer membrane lipoprotein-sorting protein [Desulfarculus baarsii]|nr:outer membrane lipoprotein-sorting protein [Desulfarculus baarsii]